MSVRIRSRALSLNNMKPSNWQLTLILIVFIITIGGCEMYTNKLKHELEMETMLKDKVIQLELNN